MVSFKKPSIAALLILVAADVCTGQTAAQPQSRQLRIEGAELSYIEQGSGTPVIFIHGAVGDYRLWEPQRDELSRKYRFIAYTQRYHGTAPWSDKGETYGLATHAADLAAFIRGLKSGPAHLVGLSYGATVAALVARDHGDLVRSVTLAEPGFFELMADVPEGKSVLDEVGKFFGQIAEVIKAGDPMRATILLIDWVTGQPRSFDRLPPAMRGILQDNARTLPLLMSAPRVETSCASLGGIKAPTLVVAGQQTPRYFSLTNERVLACIPGSRPAIVPNATHAMTYENTPAFNQALLTFLASVSEGGK